MSQTKAQLISDLVQALNFTGTSSAPANGVYLSAANELKLATASSERLMINGDGLTVQKGVTVNGIEGGDAQIRLRADEGDDNNDMYRLVVEDGGTGFKIQGYDGSFQTRLIIDSTGKVGIGTTSPDALLHLSAISPFIRFTDTADSSHYAHIGHSDSSIFYIDADAANAHAGSGIQFKVDNSNVMFLKDGGNVGIGTTSPDALLTVSSATPQIKSIDTDGTNDYSTFQNSSGISVYNAVDNNSNGQHLFQTGGTERLRIDSSGRLMLGRTTASKLFNLRETSTSTGVHIVQTIGGANHVSDYAIGLGFDPEGYAARTKIAIVAEGTSSGWSRGKLHFLLDSVNDSGEVTLSESRMSITDSGTVGIGITAPDCMLHVAKASAGTMSADGNAVLALENSNHCVLNMMSPADKSSYIMMGDPDDTNAGQIRYDNNVDTLSINVNGAEKVLISSRGNTLANAFGQRLMSPNTGSTNEFYWKVGSVKINGSEGFILTFCGTAGYSNGQQIAGVTTLYARCSNGSTLNGIFTGESSGGTLGIKNINWKHEGSNEFSIWAQVYHYSQITPFVQFFGVSSNGWTPDNTSTGSSSAPADSTAFDKYAYKQVGGVSTIQYNSNDTYFLENIRMAANKGIDFNPDSNAGGTTDEVLDDYEEGLFTPQLSGTGNGNVMGLTNGAQKLQYVRIGDLVTITGRVNTDDINGCTGGIQIGNFPFSPVNLGDQSDYAPAWCITHGITVPSGCGMTCMFEMSGGATWFNMYAAKSGSSWQAVQVTGMDSTVGNNWFQFCFSYRTS